MWRLNEEEGAVAVTVAVASLVLFALAAVSVDAGQLYQERRELQNGADAAALAVGLNCADITDSGKLVACTESILDTCSGGPIADSLLDEYAGLNANDSKSSACIVAPADPLTEKSLTVRTETVAASGQNFLTHWFAWAFSLINPDLDLSTTTVQAEATVAWGIAGGATTVPVTISYCQWSEAVPDVADLPSETMSVIPMLNPGNGTVCTGPAGQQTPGGFSWLDTDGSGECQANVTAEGPSDGDTGMAAPSGCNDGFWESKLGETVLIPIFSAVEDPGSNAKFYIEGFAAFRLAAYKFPSTNSTPPANCGPGVAFCLNGFFVEYVTYGDHLNYGGEDYGGQIVTLTK